MAFVTIGQRIATDYRQYVDEIDEKIAQDRAQERAAITTPQVGDIVIFEDGTQGRLAVDYEDSVQWAKGGSIYLGKGYASFSGSLNPLIPKAKLTDGGLVGVASFWFFHHNFPEAHAGVQCMIPVRVWHHTA